MEFEVGSCFDTYEDFEVAFNEFCVENKLNLVKTDCKTMESYFRRYGGGEDPNLLPLRFSRLVYSCSTRGFLHLKNSGRIHMCTAGVRVAVDKKLAKLKVKKIDKMHSSTCFHMQEPSIADDECKRKHKEILKRISTQSIPGVVTGSDNVSNTSDSEELGSPSFDKRSIAQKQKVFVLDGSSNTHASTDSESDWDGERHSSVLDTPTDKQMMPLLQFPDDLPTMQNLSKIKFLSIPRQRLPQLQNNPPKMRKVQKQNEERSNVRRNSPVHTANLSSSTRKNSNNSGSTAADVLNITSQVFDWADTFFVSSVCAEMNLLPKRVKNNLKLRIFEMVNKTVEECEENNIPAKCTYDGQNKQGTSAIHIEKISNSQRKTHASSSRNFPLDVRTKYQNGTSKFKNYQNGDAPSVDENTNFAQRGNYQRITNVSTDTNFSNRNNLQLHQEDAELRNRTSSSVSANRRTVGDVIIDSENRTTSDLDRLLKEVSESQSISMKEEAEWNES